MKTAGATSGVGGGTDYKCSGYLQRSTALVVSARARRSIRWTAGIALPAKKPKLFTIAPVSREGFTLALFSPWLRPCHFCLVNLKQKRKGGKEIIENETASGEKVETRALRRLATFNDTGPVASGWSSDFEGVFCCSTGLVSRSNAFVTRKPLPLPLAKFDDFVSLEYSRGDDNG